MDTEWGEKGDMIRKYMTEEAEPRHYLAWGIVAFAVILLFAIPLVPPPENLTGNAVYTGTTSEGQPSPIVQHACGCADVTGDGMVNIVDSNEIILFIGACEGANIYDSRLDVDGSGCIDEHDVSCVTSSGIRPSGC
jgi:hypothetical protein